jgi:hypothetical protein
MTMNVEYAERILNGSPREIVETIATDVREWTGSESLLRYKIGVRRRAKTLYGKETRVRVLSNRAFLEDLARLEIVRIGG